MWKVNDDLSFDSSFGAVDLGTDFASPTAANSTCVSNPSPNNYCSYVNSFVINEAADRFAFTFTRQLNGSGNSSSVSTPISTVAIGKISTGEILGKMITIEYLVQSNSASDWSYLGTTDLATSSCQTGVGNTLGGVALTDTYLNSWSLMIRPDGSVIMSADCNYTNRVDGQPLPSSLSEYDVPLYLALKPSGGSLVIDTSFGTNGFKQMFDATAMCGYNYPSWTVNSAITSNDSTALYAPILISTFPRTTTVPNNPSYNGVTSYNGCYLSGPSQSSTKIVSIQANGTTKNSVDFPAGYDYFISRWVIDPQGRWNASTRPMPMGGMQTPGSIPVEFIRLLPDGTFDSSFGTNGIKQMTSLPTSVSINGTSVNMNYSISGFATTATDTLFTGFASTSTSFTCGSAPYPDATITYYPYYVSSETGLLTSYGDSGLGAPVALETAGADRCMSGGATRLSYFNSNGDPVLFAQLRAIGAQTAGLTSITWPKADGVIGGGDGVGAVGAAAGRTDTKVYSRKLPTRTEVNTSLNVLTKKMSRTQMLRTRTPKVCVNLTQSVVLVKTGTCRLEVVDKASKQVVRRLSTRVRSTTSEVGTTVTPAENSIRFSQVSRRLSKSAKSQIAELAESAAEAQRIILVGHSAGLTENTVSNNRIALQRAAAVKAQLQKAFKAAGVKVPISIVSVGPNAPVTTKRTESAQARNRRVEVYVMP